MGNCARTAEYEQEIRETRSDSGNALFGRKRTVLAHTLVQFLLDNSKHQCYNSKSGHNDG